MDTLAIAAGAIVLYLVAYHTYGRWLGSKVFELGKNALTPAKEVDDGQDYVPTKKEVLFGHHYTSIAGVGPIVGPAIGVIWGWLPALLWVLVGSIVMGAVHDFGALVVSMRHQGRSIGDLTADLISPRVRYLFLGIVVLALGIVLAIFCLVIAALFKEYPGAVLSIWVEIPIAMLIGWLVYRKGWSALPLSLAGLFCLYFAIGVGTAWYLHGKAAGWEWLPITIPEFMLFGKKISPVVSWSVILLIYAGIASVLPVWRLLQPRDYINGHELFVVMILLVVGIIVSRPELVAPAVRTGVPGAPPMMPFLFITIACGAISGFHSLVSSGTTAKQLADERDARAVGYGGMLMEGLLAVLVIVAVCGGLGLFEKNGLTRTALWNDRFATWGGANGLKDKVDNFVNGSAAMLTTFGLPHLLGVSIMGVFVASFAGTTLDTATRLQRYAISELGKGMRLGFLANKYVATAIAIVTAGVLALHDGKGAGGLVLWPLFGATNQLLATLALLVVTVYLVKQRKPFLVTLLPCIVMFVITGWAMHHNLFGAVNKPGFVQNRQWHLVIISLVILALQTWMIVEAIVAIVLARIRRDPPADDRRPPPAPDADRDAAHCC